MIDRWALPLIAGIWYDSSTSWLLLRRVWLQMASLVLVAKFVSGIFWLYFATMGGVIKVSPIFIYFIGCNTWIRFQEEASGFCHMYDFAMVWKRQANVLLNPSTKCDFFYFHVRPFLGANVEAIKTILANTKYIIYMTTRLHGWFICDWSLWTRTAPEKKTTTYLFPCLDQINWTAGVMGKGVISAWHHGRPGLWPSRPSGPGSHLIGLGA